MNEETKSSFFSAEAEEVRRVFAALPFNQRISTLLRVELDLVADVVERAAAETSRVLDEVAKVFTGSNTPKQDTPDQPTA